VPLSGSIFSNSGKSTGFSLASSFSARFFVAMNSACDEDGRPQRTRASSRAPFVALRTIGAMRSGYTSIDGSKLPVRSRVALTKSMIAC